MHSKTHVYFPSMTTKESLAWRYATNSVLMVLAAQIDIDEAYIEEYTTRIETTRSLPSGAVDDYKNMMIGAQQTELLKHV